MAHSDPTFRSYTADQAKAYAVARGSYVSGLYEKVLKHHANSNGEFGLVVDVGCGPGNATRDIALFFDRALGVDPGEQMIATARSSGGKTKSGKDIEYQVSPAEELSTVPGLEPDSIDLLIIATAAHWFNMDKFWAQVAKVLKPNGTVAIWTSSSYYCHPNTPNAAEVQKILFKLEREMLGPYELPGNRLSRDEYENLPLPWDVTPPVTAFSKSSLFRHVYDKGGVLDNGEDFFGRSAEANLDDYDRGLRTASMFTRWKAAHPDFEGEDPLRETMRNLRDAMGGNDRMRAGCSVPLIMFKKH